MELYAFIDTNVLLHYRFFDEVDWAEAAGAGTVMLVFAPVVFAELDKRKWSGTHKEKRRADAVLKKLKALGLSVSPVAVRPKVRAMALDSEPADDVFSARRLQQQVADDRLLASLFAYSTDNLSAQVVLLTADVGFGIKARSRQVRVIEPDDSLALADEPDEVERELEKAKRELSRLQSAAPKLRLGFPGSESHLHLESSLVRPFNYMELDRFQDAWRKKHPHVGPARLTIPDLQGRAFSIKLPDLYGGYLSEEDVAKRNKEIDEYFRQYSDYVREWPSFVNAVRRTLALEIVLENAGTAPADDIHIELRTDAAGRWIEELPEIPEPPEMPKSRGPFDFGIDAHLPYLKTLPQTAFAHHGANEEGPDILDEDDGQVVEYAVRRAKHHVPCTLPTLYFQFRSDDDIASLTVNARVVAANITQPIACVLNVEIVRIAPIDPPPPGAFVGEDDQNER